MRSRNIKPGFFDNEHLGAMDPLAQLLFAGLWCLADRAGRLEDRPAWIKAKIFPYRDADVSGLLDMLATCPEPFIKRYTATTREITGAVSKRFLQVLHFTKHQNPHKNEAASTIPPFWDVAALQTDDYASTPSIDGTARVIDGSSRADSLIPDSLKNTCASADAPSFPPLDGEPFQPQFDQDDPELGPINPEPKGPPKSRLECQQAMWFEQFWERFWKRRGKKDAQKAFRRHVRTRLDFETLIAGLERDRPVMIARSPEHQKMAQGWINSEVWREAQEEPAETSDPWDSVEPTRAPQRGNL